ncbi:hypothetical protein CLOP_g19079 [Closterium sp. NIES-67]|nr:hypothetical protein CLOP_g19079 [Closterium sp. NIES-67]
MLFSEAAPETSKKVGRDDVAKAADNLVKQAVKVGIFWANSSPPKAAEAVPLLSDFHDSVLARSGLCVCGAAEGVVRCLIYLVAAWPQHRDSWGQQQLAQTPQQLQQEQEEEREQREQQPKINDDESTHMASFLETFAVAD